MGFFRGFMLVLLGLAGSVSGAFAQHNEVRLSTLDWPPYTGQNLKEQGAFAMVAKEAFRVMGYKLTIEFYPWSRAVQVIRKESGYAGYFPAYASAQRARECHFSEAIGSGPLGFAERTDKPIVWSDLTDLTDVPIGVVQDYLNTEAFDRRVAQRQLKTEVATNDIKNLQKLHGKRIDLAVVDRHVFDYLMRSSPELVHAQKALRFNGRILEEKHLFVCFKKNPQGAEWANIFNQGLKKINAAEIVAKHL
jgi:polar amino acid transport system substrate-binding protein